MGHIVAIIFGVLVGWIWAHYVVAQECVDFGKFRVGEAMYECSRIEKVKP